MNVVRVDDTVVEAQGGTIDIDGVPCDLDKVKDAVRRCVAIGGRIQEFEYIMGDIPEVVEFIDDLKAILKGTDAETDTD